ncbi:MULTISPECIES: heme exporter protein CcmB [unclassified Sphingomonas]|uniref:heme exporter protein CcmB n=1 Tax=unclassified Sphingomonas TaxID=196159 RepID=UPI0006F54320|nr:MULTISPECIES: heme exporter protein CcmB [unclassified Sphingomonas]KQX26264.1 cytochrome C biogenesis protein CcmB [Sphingomonas sp. Root1294]KQY69333.1 cytochrome C biogenesis protein CcmB [Sphingomonas sp. Root50]KRB89593.1 cytochrome C biogenesis protein CcmB [Sphingomonas sp. Root720]
MSPWGTIILRDVRLAYQGGGALLPLIFFLLVATLFPFAVGPDGPLLAKVGGGALWMAALLAALLPVDRLVAPDADSGVLDQYAVRGLSDEGIAAAKIAAHWLGFGPPLMIAALPAAALLKLDGDILFRLEAGLAIGTPALAALGVMTSALTLGLRGAGALAGLVMLPLAVPLLIFGAGALGQDGMGAIKLLGAAALLLTALAPFAAGAALRAARD